MTALAFPGAVRVERAEILDTDPATGLPLVWDGTRLAAFVKAPHAFYWRVMRGFRTPAGAAQLRGSAVHLGVETFWRSGDVVEAMRTVATAWRQGEFGETGLAPVLAALRAYAEAAPKTDQELAYLEDGTPALEVAMLRELPIRSPSGHPYYLAAIVDRLAVWRGKPVIVETKTTSAGLSSWWLQRYWPSFQFALQSLVVEDSEATVLEAIQLLRYETRITPIFLDSNPLGRGLLPSILYWIRQAEQCAAAGFWPINPTGEVPTSYHDAALLNQPEWAEAELRAVCGDPEPWSPLDRATAIYRGSPLSS